MNRDIEEYYNKYGQKVYAYLLSICREPDTAQDLTQETFSHFTSMMHYQM